MNPVKVHVSKKYKNEKERKKFEARERAKQLTKGKAPSKLTRAELDKLTIEMAKMHGIFE